MPGLTMSTFEMAGKNAKHTTKAAAVIMSTQMFRLAKVAN